MIADAMEGRVVFSAHVNQREMVSTYQIIVRTLCPKDHPCASITFWELDTIMPNVMEWELVKRIVLRLLAFRENDLAHELLKDTEWMRVAHMTQEDKVMVINHIQRQVARD